MNARDLVMTEGQAATESAVGVGTVMKIKVATEIGKVIHNTVLETRKPMEGEEVAVMTIVVEEMTKEAAMTEEARGTQVLVKVEVTIVRLAPKVAEALRVLMGSKDPMSVSNVKEKGISRENALKQVIKRSAEATRGGMIEEEAAMKGERQMRIGESVYKKVD